MAAYFVKSKRGKDILVNEGHMYHKRYERKNKVFWNCIKKQECNGVAVTYAGTLNIISVTRHNHLANEQKIKCVEVLNQMKQLACENPKVTPSQIMKNELQVIPDDVLVYLPEKAAIRRTLTRKRQVVFRANPQSISELQTISTEYISLSSGEKFLLYDSGSQKAVPRIIIYATKSNLIKLGGSSIWYMDSSYQVYSKLATQVFTIHGLYRNNPVPLVYALLENGTEETYTAVLDLIKQRSKKLKMSLTNPETIMIDCNKSLINAQQRVFPGTTLRLCFFHFRECILNVVKNNGLQDDYLNSNKNELRKGIHKLISLAFVPPEKVLMCFDILLEELPDDLLDLADYIEQTYIRGRRNNESSVELPTFPPKIWNQFNAIRNDDPKTNNLTEDWHNNFQRFLGKRHTSLYDIIHEIIKEQEKTQQMIGKMKTETWTRESQKMKYRKINQHLQKVALHYEEYEKNNQMTSYLQACETIFTL